MQTEADIEGPLKQRIAKLIRENAKLREACEAVLAWYDRDGSVGGACDPMEALRAAIDAAMKGERT